METEFSLVNLSQQWYATIGLRPAASDDSAYVQSDLVPPGAVFRERFFELFPETGGCPDRLDLRVYLYKRANDDVPIGMDPGEAVESQPVASGEVLNVLACEQVVASTYTIVLRDSEEGTGVLRFAQETGAEQERTFTGRSLPDLDTVPEHLASASLSGVVTLEDGTPVEGIGVLVRSRYRVSSDDSELCPDEPVGLCFGEPIAIDSTDEEGRFSFDRPPGAYQVEVFADGFTFRPVWVVVESPIDNITFVAEPES